MHSEDSRHGALDIVDGDPCRDCFCDPIDNLTGTACTIAALTCQSRSGSEIYIVAYNKDKEHLTYPCQKLHFLILVFTLTWETVTMPLDEIKRCMRSQKKYRTETRERYGEITAEGKKRMADFANKITPPNWNVWCESDDQVIPRRGYLNISLIAEGTNCEAYHKKHIRGLANINGIEYLSGIASTQITIYPYMGDWPGTIIHELAHVAVDRRLSLKKKPYNEPEFAFCNSRIFHIDDHDPMFDRALELLRMRLLKLYNYAYVLRYTLMNPMKN